MNVTPLAPGVKLSPSSDFDGKLVARFAPSWLNNTLVTGIGLIKPPVSVIRSRKIGEVTPKDPSGISLLNTPGKLPSAVDAALFGRRPGNGAVLAVPV